VNFKDADFWIVE
jgi:protein BUR2